MAGTFSAATLHQLQHAPAGTVFTERRGVPLTAWIGEDSAEFRSTYRALPRGTHPAVVEVQRRFERVMAQARALDELEARTRAATRRG